MGVDDSDAVVAAAAPSDSDVAVVVLPYSISARRRHRRRQRQWLESQKPTEIAPESPTPADAPEQRPPLCAEFAARRAAMGWPTPCGLPADLLEERVYEFDAASQPLIAAIAAAIGSDVASLPQLHETAELKRWLSRPTLTNLGLNPLDRRLKASGGFRKNAALRAAYHRFVREVVLPQLPEDPEGYLYQREPNLRCHLPGTGRQLVLRHCDADYFHQPHELNFWLPCTPCSGTNSMWRESRPGAADYRPVELRVGQMLRFFGNQCDHYSMPNQTGATRLSLDFRIVPRSHFRADYPGSHMQDGSPRFGIGGFFARFEQDAEGGAEADGALEQRTSDGPAEVE